MHNKKQVLNVLNEVSILLVNDKECFEHKRCLACPFGITCFSMILNNMALPSHNHRLQMVTKAIIDIELFDVDVNFKLNSDSSF